MRMVLCRSERIPPGQPRPNAAHQSRVRRRIEPRIETRDGPQTCGRPKVWRVQAGDDAKTSFVRTGAHDDRKDFVAGYVGARSPVDVNVQVVESVPRIDE